MKKEETIKLLTEKLGQNVEKQFENAEERNEHTGTNEFLISNSKNLAYQVILNYDEDLDEVSYEINANWV